MKIGPSGKVNGKVIGNAAKCVPLIIAVANAVIV